MRVGGLGDEDRSHTEIDCGAVRVEGVACGHHHANDWFSTAEFLELQHDGGQDGLRGGGAQR